MVKFSNLIKSKGKIEGENGDLSVKISRALRRVGSSKEGVVKGLPGVARVFTLACADEHLLRNMESLVAVQ